MIINVLGNVPTIKVLDFLQRSIPHDFTMAEMEEQANVGYTELRRDFKGMLDMNMVVATRKVGGVQMYTLNSDSRIVNAVVEFCDAISVREDIPGDVVYPKMSETGEDTDGGDVVTMSAGDEETVLPPEEDIASKTPSDVDEPSAEVQAA